MEDKQVPAGPLEGTRLKDNGDGTFALQVADADALAKQEAIRAAVAAQAKGTSADPSFVTGAGADFDAAPVMAVAGAYTAGDAVGALLTLTNIAPANGKQITIQNLLVRDKAKQSKGMTLIFFDANPTASTIVDNSPISIHDDDIAKIVGIVRVYAADYTDLAAGSVVRAAEAATITPASDSRTLFLAIRADEEPTYANGDLSIHAELLRDL